MTTGRINQVTIETDRPAVRPASPAAAVASPSLLRVPLDPNDAELPYGSRVAFSLRATPPSVGCWVFGSDTAPVRPAAAAMVPAPSVVGRVLPCASRSLLSSPR